MAKVNTAERILACATRMFAEHGYNGTIMDDLAARCGVNKASIYYHHQDKATLYDRALCSLFTPVADAVCSAVKAAANPVDRLDAHIRSFARASAERPDFAAILMRELASGGSNMPEGPRLQMQRILMRLTSTLQDGQQQQQFKAANAMIIHFMIVGTVNLFISSIPLRQQLPDSDKFTSLKSTDIEAAADQLARTIIDSLLIHRGNEP